MKNILSFSQIGIKDIKEVGGKASSLGEMFNVFKKDKIKIPNGFCVTASAFGFFIAENNLKEIIKKELRSIKKNDVKGLEKSSEKIRKLILKSTIPEDLAKDIVKNFNLLRAKRKLSVAVRSSATCEDLPSASFAGLHDSYVYVKTPEELLSAVKKVFASLYNARAIAYRIHNEFSEDSVAMAVGVQQMVKTDNGQSGVMFTLDTESGFDKVIMINAVYGLGEGIVSGSITPDEFIVSKECLNKNKFSILKRSLGDKSKKMVFKTSTTKLAPTPKKQIQEFCLTDDELELLGRQALLIEKHYQKAMDIEWAKDENDKAIYIVQARPETVKSLQKKDAFLQYELINKGKVLSSGRSVGDQIGQGLAQIINSPSQINSFKAGSVLVADITDPDWEPIMKQCSAIVTNRGGRTCHAAIVARELGIPAVVGTGDATKKIRPGQKVTVSCAGGDVAYVYEGFLKYKTTKVELKKLQKLPVEVAMNLGNPEQAFAAQFLPNDGVGLVRIEFIISNLIGVHPRAVIDYDQLPLKIKRRIETYIAPYASAKEFYIEKLREGISTIAAAFYPKQVIIRFSDFKSNEYANLLGGKAYEPVEENPMLGYRGAARYISKLFKPCFELECEALRRVREDMGLTNAQAMIPFTRTVDEARQVAELVELYGLKRGKNKFKLFVMCEIPSNVLLAEEFLKYFDGFSIGSNDLTQLTLGIDRDSELVASQFDERNSAVKKLLELAIDACRKSKKYIGVCGQAPSDYPELAEWLVKKGITCLSLSPDVIVRTRMYLSEGVKLTGKRS